MSSPKNDKTGAGQTTPATAKKVGTPKTEAIIGTAAAKIEAAVNSLIQGTGTLGELVKSIDDLALQVTDKEHRLAELDTIYAEKKRAYQVQNELDFREDRVKHINAYLVETDSTIISTAERDSLTTRALKNEEETRKEVTSAVHAATGAMQRSHEADKRVFEAEFKAKEAENVSRIKSLEAELAAAKAESARWQKALDDFRTSEVERSKSNAIGAVNIGQPNTR